MADPTTPDPPGETHAGGLWCHEVLVLLTRFLDGDLDDATAAAVVAHVTACDRCAEFGDAFKGAIAAIRAGAVVDDHDAAVVDVDAVFAHSD